MDKQKQLALVQKIHNKVNDIVDSGGDDQEILLAMMDDMREIESIILADIVDENLDIYLEEYDGFAHYMNLLVDVAEGLEDGSIKFPKA